MGKQRHFWRAAHGAAAWQLPRGSVCFAGAAWNVRAGAENSPNNNENRRRGEAIRKPARLEIACRAVRAARGGNCVLGSARGAAAIAESGI